MATVFSNDMVAHVWANQSQDSGRSHNGQYYFEGRALFSYGRHFVAGYVMPDGATLITGDSYSITTTRHVSRAHSAARGRVYIVPGLTDLLYPLNRLADARPGAGGRDDAKRAILQHVAKHALALGDDAAAYLLGQIGRARSWPKIRREAERAAAKRKAESTAREIAGRKAEAESMAGLHDRAFADLKAARIESPAWGRWKNARGYSEYRKATTAETLATLATELHRLGVTARAHCGKRVQAALKARLAAVRAEARRAARAEALSVDLGQFQQIKNDARALYRERMGHGPLSREGNKRLGQYCVYFLSHDRAALISPAGKSRLKATLDNCRDLERMAAERESRERMEREREARESWLAGDGPRYWRGSDAAGGALLRAVAVERDDAGRIVGGTLETSHGADCPLPHALKAFAFVRRVVATGQAWHANGHTIRVGHFRVDSIDSAGTMRAGCHTIHAAEMERLAAALGVADIAASDDALESSRGAA